MGIKEEDEDMHTQGWRWERETIKVTMFVMGGLILKGRESLRVLSRISEKISLVK